MHVCATTHVCGLEEAFKNCLLLFLFWVLEIKLSHRAWQQLLYLLSHFTGP